VVSTFYRRRGKRVLDVVGAGSALMVLSPVLAVTALAVRRRLGSPVLFVQERGGRGGSTFRLLKFRTMLDAVDRDGRPLPDEERLTPFGERLRRTSLDELPELVNVLRGEMSLVGPRPLLADYLGRYSPQQARRHEVRPGLTGWTQVNGRNGLTWPEKFDLDVWYVDHVSLGLDLRILWRTVAAVLRPEGVASEGHATMPVFLGDEARDSA
jgi:lipopolysaccharide/colanic/teichoic acid biosynthesis glycosyltransferase